MQRRIGIAQALINDPDLLILDEPTTGLDPIGTRQVKDLIIELGRRGKTVILSSHLLSDVEDVVDRMVILYGGRIRGEGTCEELLSSNERTIIETDELDDQTIAEIDEVIRRRTGGEKSIRGVTAPRQRLEELFLGIVEQAQHDKASTSGAMQGGETAAFLRGEQTEERQGEDLIESLLEDHQDEPADQASEQVTSEASEGIEELTAEPAGEDTSLIGSLMEEPESEPTPEAKKHDELQTQAPSDEDVDLGVIGSLLDDDQDDEEDDKR